jgi:RNA polymerase sigma-70 factor, ECF subfamily
MFEPKLTADHRSATDAEEQSDLDDDRLVTLAKTDSQHFGVLYDRYYSRILNYIYRRTLDVALAEELTSNTFFKAMRALGDYDERGKFSAWLYRIAGNEVRLSFRSKRRRRDEHANLRKDYARIRFATDRPTSPEDVAELARQFAGLHDALRRLPERYQTALSLRYLEGMSYEEVAEVLNKKSGTVKSLVHRGLKRLQWQIERNGANFVPDQNCLGAQERQQ